MRRSQGVSHSVFIHPSQVLMLLMGGVKISNICLYNPPPSSWKSDPNFQIKIKHNNETKSSGRSAAKKGDSDSTFRVTWKESFVFAGDISDDSLLTFTVFRPHRLFPIKLGSSTQRIVDVMKMRSKSRSCKVEIATNLHISFNIEDLSDAVPQMVSEASEAMANLLHMNVLAEPSENTWSSFLRLFQIFMNALDNVSQINPYVKLAWSILSVIPKTIIVENSRNEKVVLLYEKLKNIYEYITDAERLFEFTTSTKHSTTLCVLAQQTVECAYFIRAYSTRNIVKNMIIGVGGGTDDKIQEFNYKLDHLKNVLMDSIVLETNIVTLRISKRIDVQRDLTLLEGMPYESDAGFIPSKRCFPGTRQTLIDEILKWVNDVTLPQVLVISGQAGTGKSAVAHTIAGLFREQNRLGSIFCFDRSYKDRRKYIFSTISRDLADGDDMWHRELVKVIDKAAVGKTKDPKIQFDELILKPSSEVKTVGPVVIIIDALDESGDRKDRREILGLLFDGCSKLPKNYRVIITSRPEQDIELKCQDSNIVYKGMCDISVGEARCDIQTYFSICLAPISSILDEIDKRWCNILVECAENLFQWAQTACQFIDPTAKHPKLIKEKWETCVSGASLSLHGLYRQIILSQSESYSVGFMNDFRIIVGAIITAREPLTIHALEEIFRDIRDVKTTLLPFGSLFVGIHKSSTPIRPLHSSLFDFFMDKENTEYHIDTSDQSVMTNACLKLMDRMLCFNICQLETSHLPDRRVPGFDLRVKGAIPLHLSYSCRFWTFHLQSSVCSPDLIRGVRSLMNFNLLYLFEILSLLGKMEEGCVAMRILANWCIDADKDLAADAMDAWKFGYEFGNMIMESTPHLYLSALPFTPRDSFISKQYLSSYPGLFTFDIGEPVQSSRNIDIVRKYTSGQPTVLAFSPKNNYLATGSSCGEFWVWNYVTEELVYQYRTHNEASICDIIFSPDGELVYCCFRTSRILCWNIKTGTDHIWFDDSNDPIIDEKSFFTVSPNGRFVAIWVKNDGFIHDLETNEVLKRFKRLDHHNSLAKFSPNGDFVAFFGAPHVWVWNIRTSEMVLTESGFQKDLTLTNDHIATVSVSNMIRIWDIRTSTMIAEIGDKNFIDFFRLSPDGQYVLSSLGNACSLWSISTGKPISQSSLDDRICCLSFSHDSTSIALGTMDGTISVHQRNDPSIQQNSSQAVRNDNVPDQLLLSGRYLILFYNVAYHRFRLQVWDTSTTNAIIFETELLGSRETVTFFLDEQHTHVAYWAKHGLCLWDYIQGEVILDSGDPVNHFSIWTTHALASSDNYLISIVGGIIKVWDIRTRNLILGPYKAGPDYQLSKLFLAGSKLVVTDVDSIIEIRDCESGHILGGPFKKKNDARIVAFSAKETHIACISRRGIEILDASTGAKVNWIPFSRHNSHKLSANQKYVMWLDNETLKIFDMDTEMLLNGPPLRQNTAAGMMFWFSTDSSHIITATHTDCFKKATHLSIWNIQEQKLTIEPIWIALEPSCICAVDLNNGRLGLSVSSHSLTYRSIAIWDMDAYKKMSALYFSRHNIPQNPVGTSSKAKRLPLSPSGSTKKNADEINAVLNYAQRAWKKASLPASAAIYGGWVYGLHNELLFWVPNKRREGFWFPCTMHVPCHDVTKLNFDKFVHGARWTNCRRQIK